jgi:hypothetical protein
MKHLMLLSFIVSLFTLSDASYAVSLTGQIKLPQGVVLLENASIEVGVTVFNTSGSYQSRELTVVVLQAGNSSVEFQLEAENEPAGFYEIEAEIINCASCASSIYRYTRYSRPGSSPIKFLGDNRDNYRRSYYESLSDISLTFSRSTKVDGTLSILSDAVRTETIRPDVIIEMIGPDSTSSMFFYDSSLNIPIGETSTTFEVYIPIFETAKYRLGFSCLSCDGFPQRGYYANSDIVTEEGLATLFDSPQNIQGVDLLLRKTNSLAGTISLPQGVSTTDVLNVRVSLYEVDQLGNLLGNDPASTQSVQIEGGETQAPFSFNFPSLSTKSYVVALSCYSCGPVVEFVYYNIDQAEQGIAAASVISSRININNLNIKLLAAQSFSGKLMLPDGETITSAAFPEVRLELYDDQGEYLGSTETFLTLPPGQPHVDFELYFAPMNGGSVRLSYRCYSSCGKIRSQGYYTQSGTVASFDQFNRIDLESISSPVAFSLLLSNQLTGLILRPDGLNVDQAANINLQLQAYDNGAPSNSYHQSVNLEAGQQSTPFTINVPQGEAAEYELKYSCFYSCGDIAAFGYYTVSGTMPDSQKASRFQIVQDINGFSFELSKANFIDGELARPLSSDIATGVTVELRLEEYDLNDDLIHSRYHLIEIPENEGSVAFSLPILPEPNNRYRLSYYCYNCPGVYSQGWHNVAMTVAVESEASLLDSSAFGASFRFGLLPERNLSVTVKRPSQALLDQAFTAQLNIEVFDQQLNTFRYSSALANFDSGQSSTTVELVLAPLENGFYKLSYLCNDCSGVSRIGYLSGDGTFSVNSVDGDRIPFNAGLDSFTLLSAVKISGTLSRPQGSDITEQLESQVVVNRLNGLGNSVQFKSVATPIPAGSATTTFSVEVDQGLPVEYEISYRCSNCSGIAETAAPLLRLPGEDLSEIQLEMIAQGTFPARTLSLAGKVIRPENTDVGKDISVRIIVRPSFGQPSSQDVIIPAGVANTAFNLSVSDSSNSYTLSYECLANCQEIYPAGYLSAGGISSTGDLPAAQFHPPDEVSNVSLPLVGQKVFSGSIALSESVVVPANRRVTLRAEKLSESGRVISTISQSITFAEGQRSKLFWIAVPSDSSAYSNDVYRVSYRCDFCDGIVRTGYFSDQGTTSFQQESTDISNANFRGDIDLEIKKSHSARGTISRPNGDSAEAELSLSVVATLLDNQFNYVDGRTTSVTIPAGTNMVEYEVFLPDALGNILLSYTVDNGLSYLRKGYYSASQTVGSMRDASLLNSLDSYQGVDFTLLSNALITGTLKRPSNASTEQALSVSLYVRDQQPNGDFLGNRSLAFVIPSGQVSVPIYVPVNPTEGARHNISYTCEACAGIVRTGYFDGTSTQPFSPTQIPEFDIDGVEIELIAGVEITGTIVRPVGSDNSLDVEPSVRLDLENSDRLGESISAYDQVVIAAGEDSTVYSVTLPEQIPGPYSLGYTCFDCGPLTGEGYISTEGSIDSVQNRALFTLDEVSQIEPLVMDRAISVSGAVSRRASDAAITPLTVYVSIQSSGHSFTSENVTLTLEPEVLNKAFTAYVSRRNDYFVFYSCYQCEDTVERGYFSQSGTTTNFNDAFLLSNALEFNSIDLQLLELNTFNLSGVLSRPEGSNSSLPYYVQILATQSNFTFNSTGSLANTDLVIPAGSSEVGFDLQIPLGATAILEYRCGPFCKGASYYGYYNSVATKSQKVNGDAFSASATGLRFEMAEVITLSGSLVRADGADIEKEIQTRVYVTETGISFPNQHSFQPGVYQQPVVLNQGELSTEFSFDVSAADDANKTIQYQCFYCDPGFERGYYSVAGTQAARYHADELTNSDTLTGLMLPILKQDEWRVTLNRNAIGIADQTTFLTLTLTEANLEDGQYPISYSQSVTIEANETSAEFAVPAPSLAERSVQISYRCWSGCRGILSEAYYSTGGTVPTQSQATILPMQSPNEALLLDLAENWSLRVTLFTPFFLGDSTSATGINAQIVIETLTETLELINSYSHEVTIQSNGLSATASFSIDQSGAAFYRVSYLCSSCTEFSPQGYIGENSSVGLREAARLYRFDATSQESLQLVLLAEGFEDTDFDGVPDDRDNCPNTANSNQLNQDDDYQGDLCDQDSDNDLVTNGVDNCPLMANNDQKDLDSDLLGDVCDTDIDGDRVLNVFDISPLDAHACYDQDTDFCDDCSSGTENAGNDGIDLDGDGVCAISDADDDGDNVIDTIDNCPLLANENQANADDDSYGDFCDADDDNDLVNDIDDCSPTNKQLWQLLNVYIDSDNDGFGAGIEQEICSGVTLQNGYSDVSGDNCASVANSQQLNSDDDKFGNACDLDDDNDQISDTDDNCPVDSNTSQLDLDSDLTGDVCDEDKDNDGILNIFDSNPVNPMVCEDRDADSCDDCAVGVDGFGPLSDSNILSDGLDTDLDGMCNISDANDDNDAHEDEFDNCPLIANDGQADVDENGTGDLCEVRIDDQLCLPIKTGNSSLVFICL